MAQEFKIAKGTKRSFLSFALIFSLCFFCLAYVEIQIWHDPTSINFEKYVANPWFILYSSGYAIILLYNAFFMKISITRWHIKFHSFGTTIVATWSELIAIENSRTMFGKREQIVVSKSSRKKNLLVHATHHIPIHHFGEGWRLTKLGQQIQRYAPHLFEQETKIGTLNSVHGENKMEQEFKISESTKSFFLVSALIWFLLFLSLAYLEIQDLQDPTGTSVIVSVLYLLGTLALLLGAMQDAYNAFSMKIIINKDDIEFHSFGYTIVADWSRLITIENGGILRKFERISVLKSSVKRNLFGLFAPRPYNIPIHYFGENWRHTKLGQRIRRYAPDLFE